MQDIAADPEFSDDVATLRMSSGFGAPLARRVRPGQRGHVGADDGLPHGRPEEPALSRPDGSRFRLSLTQAIPSRCAGAPCSSRSSATADSPPPPSSRRRATGAARTTCSGCSSAVGTRRSYHVDNRIKVKGFNYLVSLIRDKQFPYLQELDVHRKRGRRE